MSIEGKLDCIKRLGKVLLGYVEPSVEAVKREAHAVVALVHQQPLAAGLHKVYDDSLGEPLPDHLAGLVDKLNKTEGPRHYVPSKGGNHGKGRHRPD